MSLWLNNAAAYVGVGTVEGELRDLGRYPGLILAIDSKRHVRGDLFRLPKNHRSLLRRLDEYEGCGAGFAQPQEYRRIIIDVHMAGRVQRAWTYVYQWPFGRARVIASGDFLRRR